MLQIKRVYQKSDKSDGFRILVDRLWPRGLTKEKASVDLWLKDIAPSDGLRKWFGHIPQKWPDFKKRYFLELKDNGEQVGLIREKIKKGKVTLLFGAKDENYNNAVALKDFLEKIRSFTPAPY